MILLKNAYGGRSVYDSVRSAAEFLGVSCASVYYALKNETLCKEHRVKKVEDFYAVKIGKDVLVCKKSADGRSWLPCCSVQQFPIGKESSAINISRDIWSASSK